ncbi:D-alanyl-D-alanine carboxypeptidase [Rhodomicrobium sp. Az07]|uniref:D-alanyl-D-alanine carboxypeptidase n=1 Tax=Rhodomicrobium sp. Az07 TaxID=2839034 RepID=UPI001BE5B509|nr:D-alanyl-D-alanine carboxypeptidase [Rhodomicrobium sp. Az07]MBT3069977.1 D-alanyl-D-alanine carboxypeptidase [Rhodomicrobium sp. Az07]
MARDQPPRHDFAREGIARRVSPVAVLLCAMAVLLLALSGSAEARRKASRAPSYSPASSAMVVDFHTGRILIARNATDPRFPASITKVMTLYLLFDALRDGKLGMSTKLRVSAYAASQSPTKLGLRPGDTIAVSDAIGAIVTKSANDVAVVVAEALAGSEEEFARRMTQRARTIGMLNTTFRNASGLPNSEQRTTAQDLVIMARAVLTDHPERAGVFKTKYFRYGGDIYRNHNTLLFSYPGMEGMKTGFTSASGFNLLATARRGEKRLIAVVLGGSSARARNGAMRNILDASWSKAMTLTAAKKAGALVASLAPKQFAAAAPAKLPSAPEPRQVASAEQTAKDAAPVQTTPGGTAHLRRVSRLPAGALQLKRKPDSASNAILFSSLENSLAVRATREPAETSDTSTDEPEEATGRAMVDHDVTASGSKQAAVTVTFPGPGEAQPKNMSVHNKTVRLPEVAPLAAAAVQAEGEAAEAFASEASPRLSEGATLASTVAPELRTIATAEAAASRETVNLPGPYHVQVGAFPEKSQAQLRLESVRQALGPAFCKSHPDFIMPVSLASGATMFRARFARFDDETKAKSVCRKLKRSGIECMNVRAP